MGKLGSLQNSVTITQNLLGLSVGLQIPALVLAYKNQILLKEIKRDVKEIKGKFEIHFLDRSLDYFLSTHRESCGVILPVLNVLEKDVFIALQELTESSRLMLPNFLEHKLISFTQSLKAINEVIYGAIHDGAVHPISRDSVKQWIERNQNIANRSPDGGYLDQVLVTDEWANFLDSKEQERSWFSSEKKNLIERSISKENFERCRRLVTLARELQYASDLSQSLANKIEKFEFPALLIRSGLPQK